MLGKISLANPGRFSLDIEAYSNSRFQKSYNKAFRPEHISVDQGQVLKLGTLLYKNSSISMDKLFTLLNSSSTESVLQDLDGLFLIVHFNAKTETLTIANNNYQLTKLYYARSGQNLIFSQQLELILPLLEKKEVHFPALLNFLKNGFNQSEQTQVTGVMKLLPSQWIKVSKDSFKVNNLWKNHYKLDRKPFSDVEKKLNDYENVYQSTLSNYLDARSPDELGMLLSGGHDTSFLLIQSSKVFKKPIQCFTTVFSNWGFSEKSFAESTCKKFGGKFHPKEFNGDDLDLLIDLIASCEEPVLGSSLPLHSLGQFASDYTDTMMGGDGGDTLWGEYHPVGEYHRWVKNWPVTARKSAHSLALLFRNIADWERLWELEHVANLFVGENYYDNFLSELCTYRHFSSNYLSSLLNSEIFASPPARSSMEIPFNKDNFNEALIEGKLFNGFYTYQSFQQTRSMNSHGMEFFLPTIQKDVMRFINSLPMEWINGGTTFHRLINSKTMNRKFHKFALARYLKKEEIYNRSFDIPWHLIWQNRQNTLELARQAIIKRNWYDPKVIDELFFRFKAQKNKDYELLELKSHGYRVMTLLAIEIWTRIFMDSNSKKPSPGTLLDDLLC